jgi:hypothetical protein
VNPNMRPASARACHAFFACCAERGPTLTKIRPFDVATYMLQKWTVRWFGPSSAWSYSNQAV